MRDIGKPYDDRNIDSVLAGNGMETFLTEVNPDASRSEYMLRADGSVYCLTDYAAAAIGQAPRMTSRTLYDQSGSRYARVAELREPSVDRGEGKRKNERIKRLKTNCGEFQ